MLVHPSHFQITPMAEPIHDKGYKRLFSNQRIFRQLIESFVSEPWVDDLDFDQCQRIDKSFISDHYKETESDLVYQVGFKGSPAYIYLLVEFQSTAPWYMALRMLNYVSNFYMDWLGSNPKAKKLPPLFPLVLYNGDSPWKAATDFLELLEQPDLLGVYTPRLHYFKIAVNEQHLQALSALGNIVSTLFLVEQTDDVEVLKQEFIAMYIREGDEQACSLLLNWFKQLALRGVRSSDDYQEVEDEVYDTIDKVTSMLDKTLKNYGQKFFVKGEELGWQKGLQEGRQEGRQEGIEQTRRATVLNAYQAGLPIGTIAKIVQMEAAEVEKLLAQSRQ